jgi:hypothetical protein
MLGASGAGRPNVSVIDGAITVTASASHIGTSAQGSPGSILTVGLR